MIFEYTARPARVLALAGLTVTLSNPVASGALTPPTIASTAAVRAPAIGLAATLAPAAIAASSAVRPPSVTTEGLVAPGAIATGSAVQVPVVSSAGLVQPAPLESAAVVRAPVVGAAGLVQPALVASGAVVAAPTLAAVVTIAPAMIGASSGLAAPAIGGAVAIQPAIVAAGSAVRSPALTLGVAPSLVAIGSALFAPAVTSAPSAPAGFARNGSTNTGLQSLLASGGNLVIKGDSALGAGIGGAITSGTGTVAEQSANARQYRPAAVLAAELTAAGYPASDSGFTGDHGLAAANTGVGYSTYDPRVSGAAVVSSGEQVFAGGGYLTVPSGIQYFTPAEPVTGFELVMFNVGGTIAFNVDDALPGSAILAPGCTVSGNQVTMPATSNGFSRITIPAGALGPHKLGMVNGGGTPLARSIRGVNPSAPIQIVSHGSAGARAADQAASGNGWQNNDALGYDAPKLTIICLGINDAGGSVSASSYIASVTAMVNKAKLTGDVLLVTPFLVSTGYASSANQTALRDALASYAATNSIAYLDLQAYFGPFSAARMANAEGNHLNRAGYAEVGLVLRQCIQTMAA